MTTIITILTEDFADWETSLLNAVGRQFYGFETAYATMDGTPVRSAGGMRVTPDLKVSDIEMGALDALIVCGGGAWESANAPDVTAVLRATHESGKLVAGICAATLQLAKAGLLDDIAHTSNSPGFLDQTGYAGRAHYRDGANAVLDRQIVTAAGTSPVSFMERVMAGLGQSDDNLAYYLALHAAQFGAHKLAA